MMLVVVDGAPHGGFRGGPAPHGGGAVAGGGAYAQMIATLRLMIVQHQLTPTQAERGPFLWC